MGRPFPPAILAACTTPLFARICMESESCWRERPTEDIDADTEELIDIALKEAQDVMHSG